VANIKKQKKVLGDRTQRAQNLATIVARGEMTPLANKICKPLKLTVNGAKTAIVRTIKGVNTDYNAAKVLDAAEKYYGTTSSPEGNRPTETTTESTVGDKIRKEYTESTKRVEKTTKKRGNYNAGGTTIGKASEEIKAKMQKQLSYVTHEMMRHHISVWPLAGQIYKQLGVENQKQASSRIYRALEMSGYVENVAPVLEFLYNHLKQEYGTSPVDMEYGVSQKAETTPKASKPAKVEKAHTKGGCSGCSAHPAEPKSASPFARCEAMLREIRASIEENRWNFADIIARIPESFCSVAGIAPFMLPAAIEALVRHPETVRSMFNGGGHFFKMLESVVTGIWTEIPRKQTTPFQETVKKFMAQVENGMTELTKLVSTFDKN
jgi:hypothetical protein